MISLRILVVDDEKGYRDEICEYLADSGFEVQSAASPSEAIALQSS